MTEGQSGLRSFAMKASGKGCEDVQDRTMHVVLNSTSLYTILIGVSNKQFQMNEVLPNSVPLCLSTRLHCARPLFLLMFCSPFLRTRQLSGSFPGFWAGSERACRLTFSVRWIKNSLARQRSTYSTVFRFWSYLRDVACFLPFSPLCRSNSTCLVWTLIRPKPESGERPLRKSTLGTTPKLGRHFAQTYVICLLLLLVFFLIFARVLYGAGKTWNSVADVKLEHAVDTSREPITVKNASVDSDAFTLVPTGE